MLANRCCPCPHVARSVISSVLYADSSVLGGGDDDALVDNSFRRQRRGLLGHNLNTADFSTVVNLTETTAALCASMLEASLFPGATAKAVKQRFGLACFRESAAVAPGCTLTTATESDSVLLPATFSTDVDLSGDYYDFSLVSFAQNLFARSNTSINGGVVAISAFDTDFSDALVVDQLSKPAVLSIEVDEPFNQSAALRHGHCYGDEVLKLDCPLGVEPYACNATDAVSIYAECPRVIPTCLWWDWSVLSWRDQGCIVVNSTDTNVTCKCDRLPDVIAVGYNTSLLSVSVVETATAPTPMPSQTMTPGPSIGSQTMTPEPSIGVTDSATVDIKLVLVMDGIQCTNYTSAIESVVNMALATVIQGASEEDFGDHTCSDVTRRRELLDTTGSISVTTTATVDSSTYNDDATTISASVSATVSAAASDGSLTSFIITEAASLGLSLSNLISVTSASVSSSQSASPTSVPPSTTPTPQPTIQADSPSSFAPSYQLASTTADGTGDDSDYWSAGTVMIACASVLFMACIWSLVIWQRRADEKYESKLDQGGELGTSTLRSRLALFQLRKCLLALGLGLGVGAILTLTLVGHGLSTEYGQILKLGIVAVGIIWALALGAWGKMRWRELEGHKNKLAAAIARVEAANVAIVRVEANEDDDRFENTAFSGLFDSPLREGEAPVDDQCDVDTNAPLCEGEAPVGDQCDVDTNAPLCEGEAPVDDQCDVDTNAVDLETVELEIVPSMVERREDVDFGCIEESLGCGVSTMTHCKELDQGDDSLPPPKSQSPEFHGPLRSAIPIDFTRATVQGYDLDNMGDLVTNEVDVNQTEIEVSRLVSHPRTTTGGEESPHSEMSREC